MILPGPVRRGLSYLITGTVIESGIGLATQLILARLLAPEQFGRFAMVMALAGLVLATLSLRLAIIIIRTPEAQMTLERRRTYYAALTLESLAGGILALAGLAVGGDIRGWDLVLVAAVALQHWLSVNRAFFERDMPYKQIVQVDSATVLLSNGAALGLALVGAGAAALYAREAVAALARLAGMRLIGGLTVYRLHLPSLSEWRLLLREARGLWLDGFLEGAFQRVALLTVGSLGNERITGLYFFAQRLAIVPHQLIGPALGRVASTWMAQAESHQRAAMRTRLGLLAALPLLAASVATVTLADPVVPWLFGETWRDCVPVLRALVGVVMFMTLTEVVKVYLLVQSHTRTLLVGRLLHFVGFGLPLLPVLWGMGPTLLQVATGTSLAYALAFAGMSALIFRRERRIRPCAG